MPYANELLAAEMSTISVVKSEELVKVSNSTDELLEHQRKLANMVENVSDVAETISNLEPHQITRAAVETLDKQLVNTGLLESTIVDGTESLGREIKPSQWKKDRLTGCESIIEDVSKSIGNIGRLISSNFSDAKVLFTESVDSSSSALNKLLEDIEASTHPNTLNGVKIDLGFRLFNLLRVDGKRSDQFVQDVKRVENYISALTRIYYKQSSDELNQLFAVFNKFLLIEDDEAAKLYLSKLPYSIGNRHFKECTISVPSTSKTMEMKISKNMIGDRYFQSQIVDVKGYDFNRLEELERWIYTYNKEHGLFLSAKPDKVLTGEFNVNVPGKAALKAIVETMQNALSSWRTVYQLGDAGMVSDKEFLAMHKEIDNMMVSNSIKRTTSVLYTNAVINNQRGLVDIRSQITGYLVLLSNAILSFCYASLKKAEEEA